MILKRCVFKTVSSMRDQIDGRFSKYLPHIPQYSGQLVFVHCIKLTSVQMYVPYSWQLDNLLMHGAGVVVGPPEMNIYINIYK